MTTTTTPLTPESIAMRSTMNLVEAYEYYNVLLRIAAIDSLDLSELIQIHTLIMDSARDFGLKAMTHVPGLGYVLVAAPIAVARAMLSMVRWEQKLLGGGA